MPSELPENALFVYSERVSDPEQLTLHPPLLIGIAGCSGSGKTTLAREIAQQLNATLLPLDFYYHDMSHLPMEERACANFDHPDSLESPLLVEHVDTLLQGKPIARPIYDFSTHTRVPEQFDHIPSTPVLIVEGILALHYPALRALYDFSIYVDAPHDICLMRRIHRDVRERGRTEESVREQYDQTARPMADEYVVPSAEYASLVVAGTEALDWSVEQILRALHQRKLLR